MDIVDAVYTYIRRIIVYHGLNRYFVYFGKPENERV